MYSYRLFNISTPTYLHVEENKMKGNNLVGYFMHKFTDKSLNPEFNLFAEIVLAIGELSDEDFDKITNGEIK